MVICKYYLQGSCRFGDRCHFEHPRGNSGYNSRNDGGFDLRNRLNSRSQDDYAPTGSGGFSGSQNQNYNQRNQRYNNRNSNFQPPHQQNRFQKLSEYDGFSKSDGNNRSHPNQGEPTAQEALQAVCQDMDEWEKNPSMWLFSCYTFTKEMPSMPDLGLDDISPEEMRLKAYEAEASRNQAQYKNWFNQTRIDYINRRKELIQPNVTYKVKLLEIIEGVLKSSKASGTSSFGSSATSGGFGSSNTQSSFGGGNVQTGLFSTQSTVGGSQSTGLFGKPTSATTPSIFGGGVSTGGTGGVALTATGFGGGASTGTGFGGGATIGTSSFGGGDTSTGFGGGATTNTGFGAGVQTTSGFGGAAIQSTGLFGKPATTAGSIFGGGVSSSSTAGLFGNPTSSQSSPAVFGGGMAAVPQNNPPGALFGGVSNPGDASSQQPSFTTPSSQPSSFSNTNQSTGFGGFGQTKPQSQGSNLMGQSKSSQYTPLDQLTSEERTAFEAPKFILGKIPTRPPPREFV